jgi:ornithine cyclodeaminase
MRCSGRRAGVKGRTTLKGVDVSTTISLETIKSVLPRLDVVGLMEQGFVAYSEGRAVVPPVAELIFEDPPGETHIKYGYIRGGDHFVIKVASGFYGNTELGLATGQGVMLLFSQKTGAFEAALLDEGHLTDVRTAAAGAVAGKHLAPSDVGCIGILGGGLQARLQLEILQPFTACRRVVAWTYDDAEVEPYLEYFAASNFQIEFVASPEEVAGRSNLIVTTTISKEPLLMGDWIRPGTHITAMGSDTAEKIELAPEILGNADRVVVDSLSQSESRGEVFRAVDSGALRRKSVVELGAVVAGTVTGRVDDQQITVCDLTGVAVQDLMVAQGVMDQVVRKSSEKQS